MNTPTHTPGPWHVGFKPGPIVYSAQGEQVANLFEPLIDAEENKANARLIACAPQLLEQLQIMTQFYDSVINECGLVPNGKQIVCLVNARALIAKATA
jgi:hypothetical protein